jgi:hypothetical protein
VASKWTKSYNRDAHRALASEGLAPQVYKIWPHPISFEWVEVFMEKLGPEWLSLEVQTHHTLHLFITLGGGRLLLICASKKLH